MPTNKYAEGYPGRRYYGGCEVVDEIEQLAIDRAKALFGAEHANVQPHAGAQTNMAVYFSCLEPGDTILAMRLDHGGHLTHGLKVNFSGKLYDVVGYGVDRETGLIDFDEVRRLARGAPAEADRLRRLRLPAHDRGRALPRDRRRGGGAAPLRHGAHRRARRRRPAPEPGAALRLRHLDEPQDARRPARRLHPLQGGARGGVDKAVFPGMQGGPLLHVIAAKATCFKIAASDAFRAYQGQIRANADALAAALLEGGFDLLTGGTDTHLVQVDLRRSDWTGRAAEERLHEVQHHREPKHGALRRAPAHGGLRASGSARRP